MMINRKENRFIAHCSLLIAHCLLLANIVFAEELPALDLQQLIDEAVKNNPELISAKYRVNAFKEVPSQMGTLADPKIEIGLLKVPMNTLSANEPMKEITVMQSLPYPGKLSLKSEMAQREAEAAEEEYKDMEIKLIQMVKDAYYDLYFIYKAVEITERNKLALQDFVKIAEAKYSVGMGLQQDVLKAQVELSKTIDELIRFERERQSAEARLNILMNRLPQSLLGKPGDIKKNEFRFTIEELQSTSVENRPLLKGLEKMIERYKAAYNLAKLEYYPDFDVGLSLGQEKNNMNSVSGKFSLNIPLWYKTKQDKKVVEESYNINSAKERYNAAKNDIFLKIKEIMAEEEKGRRLIELFLSGIIPQATQSLSFALAGYQVNKVDFLTLLDNQITLFNYQVQYERVLSDYERKLAELEAVVGKRLF
ncbi:MAG: TolC family protein [Nitrospinae bacterium]|nr:TolC family protein [Nitrospinota bacterium]